MTRRQRVGAWVLGLLLGGSVLGYRGLSWLVGGFLTDHERSFHSKLRRALETGQQEISVADLTDFEWERLCATFYLVDLVQLDGDLGFTCDVCRKLGWLGEDGAWGLFFVSRDRRVTPIRVYQRIIDGGPGPNSTCVMRGFAKLVRVPGNSVALRSDLRP